MRPLEILLLVGDLVAFLLLVAPRLAHDAIFTLDRLAALNQADPTAS
ncbi:MAG TPA: hypothetical protein VFA46_21465 [Actinomycetes bacterium]|nr:hypothetical protein [Actinomycetes bacterium]